MRYVSYETRKVLDCIDEYGVSLPEDDYFDIEIDVGTFWNTHIQQVCRQVLEGGDIDKKLAKIGVQGWEYFRKPVRSLLTPRGQAHRTDQIVITLEVRPVYNVITSGFARADFNMKELAMVVQEIPQLINEVNDISVAMRAAGDNRSIYYLAGILRREYQSRQGKIREIQEKSAQNENNGWTPPAIEPLDIIERRQLAADWQDRLNNLSISKSLDEHVR